MTQGDDDGAIYITTACTSSYIKQVNMLIPFSVIVYLVVLTSSAHVGLSAHYEGQYTHKYRFIIVLMLQHTQRERERVLKANA